MMTKNKLLTKLILLTVMLVGGVSGVWGQDELVILGSHDKAYTIEGTNHSVAGYSSGESTEATLTDATDGQSANAGSKLDKTSNQGSNLANKGHVRFTVDAGETVRFYYYQTAGSNKVTKIATSDYTKNSGYYHAAAEFTAAAKNTLYYVDFVFDDAGTYAICTTDGQSIFAAALKFTAGTILPKHTVTYSLGDGTGTAPTQADVAEGRTFTVAAAPANLVAPTGKEFKCWNDGTTDYEAGATYTMGTSNVTLTAVYQNETVKYSVTYSLGEGTGTAPTQESLAEGNTFTVAAAPSDLVAPTGKEFKCWNDGTNNYDAGATYTMSATNVTLTAVYQDRTYGGMKPSTVLDLSNSTSTTFTTNWYTSNGVQNDCYYDVANGVVVFSAYALYQGKSSQTWMNTDSGNSLNGEAWNATGAFKGGEFYFGVKASKYYWASIRNTERCHYYRVTNCIGASAFVGGKAIIDAYEVNGDIVSADPVKTNTTTSGGTLSLTGLDATKEYIIKVYGDNGNSNVAYYEIAFNFPASVSATIASSGYTTYCSPYDLSFEDVEGLEAAYVVTTSTTSTATLKKVTAVPGGTGVILKGTAGAVTIPVAEYTGEAISNILVGTLNATPVTAESVYVVSDGKFKLFAGTEIPAGKAYLPASAIGSNGGNAPSLSFDFGGETTGLSEELRVNSKESIYYDLLGRRVAQPTKGLYIVNGKKVLVP